MSSILFCISTTIKSKFILKIIFAISLMTISSVMLNCASASKSTKPEPESGQQVEIEKPNETNY